MLAVGAGGSGGACWDASGAGCGCAAGAGGAEAAAAALPGAGRMVNVRAGTVAVRGWLACVSHHLTVSAGIV